ncbi:MAG: hypothetical protein ACXW04_06790, partial [Methylobacter sp.]
MALVPPDSPLRLVPTTLERKAVLFFDGIRYSFHIFDLAAARLTTTLHELSQEQEDKAAIADRIALAMSDAWMLIDSAHRLRELVEQAPRLRKKQPELQLFLRRTANVEVLRNFFQHFRNEIDAFANQAIPLWGTLTWAYVSPETGAPQNYTIAPGTIFNDVTLHTCTFDTVKWKYGERVLLYAGSTKLDLAALFEHVTEFASWYTEWFRIQFPDTDHHCADLHMCMGVK